MIQIKKILLLGGSYFIGLAILNTLKEDGNVTILNRGTKLIEIPNIKHIKCDRRNIKELKEKLVEQYDIIVDVSAYEPIDVENIMVALKTLPEKYIFISSSAVYLREKSPFPLNENAPVGGDLIWGEYGVLKYECEKTLSKFTIPKKFVIRPPYVYGPNNYLEREQFIWTRLVSKKPIFVPGDGETLIQFCYVDDIANFVEEIINSDTVKQGIYNIGESSYYSFNDYIKVLSQISNSKPILKYINNKEIKAREYFPFRQNHLILDVKKINQVSTHHETDLYNGLRMTYDWFSKHEIINYIPTKMEKSWLNDK